MGRLDTSLIRVRARMSVALDMPLPTATAETHITPTGRISKSEAKRRAIDYLLANPTVLEEHLTVTFRLPELHELDETSKT